MPVETLLRTIATHVKDLSGRYRSFPYLLSLALLPLVFYWRAATLQGAFYVGDALRFNTAIRSIYAAELRRGRIPLWTPDALAGYPILAEGQTGTYYPLNLLLYRCLPLPAAMNYSVLLSLWIAGAGLFLYARCLGLRRGPAFLAGCIFMLGGFLPAHLIHTNLLAAAAWLPLLLWAVERAVRCRRWQAWTPVAIIFALQGLAGHPQIPLLSAILASAQSLAGPLVGADRPSLRRQVSQLALCLAALAGGAALALVQWAPTYELMRLSQRASRLDYEHFSAFSISRANLLAMLSPFPNRDPRLFSTPGQYTYLGAVALVFAALALWRRRDRAVAFWTGVAALAVFLALGRWNPAYRLLWYVPVLNRFRAPDRYLLWLDLAVGILAAVTVDSFLALTSAGRRRQWIVALGAGLALAVAAWAPQTGLRDLLTAWQWLPFVWFAAAIGLLVALRWRPLAYLWAALVLGVLLADLGAYHGVYSRTFNDLKPPAKILRVPRVARFLQADAGSTPYRVYTNGKVLQLSVLRDTLFPNLQMLYGVQSLGGYFVLIPEWQRWMLDNLSPRLLDLANVRYVLVPQAAPDHKPNQFDNSPDPFALSLEGRSFDFAARPVVALEVEGYLSRSARLPDGSPVAEVILKGGGSKRSWTLRAGIDLADWAYAREDVQPRVRHRQPGMVARSWPAQSEDPARYHVGRTYRARWVLPEALQATAVEVHSLVPRGHLRLENLRLFDPTGKADLLSALVGKGDHVMVYRNTRVAVYRNVTAGPRAFLVHRARICTEEEARRLVLAPEFDPWQEVVLLEGQELSAAASPADRVAIEAYEPEYVRLCASTASPAYLVLADSYYPGWTALLDGQPIPVRRADVFLRAMALPPGEHRVELFFRPRSCLFGQIASAVGWLAAGAIMLIYWKESTAAKTPHGG